jgi:hypothetical protein
MAANSGRGQVSDTSVIVTDARNADTNELISVDDIAELTVVPINY